MATEHPFKWVPSLRHITKVKIIQTVWRSLEDKKVMKDECMKKIRDGRQHRICDLYDHSIPVLEELSIAVNHLPLPESLKLDLESFLLFMIGGVLLWLRSTGVIRAALKDRNRDWAETICYFVDHIVWNDFGCVDGQKILEFYLSNEETIPFSVWDQLCYHCSENDIIKFAKTFDWDNCKDCFESHYAVYWYHKFYGKFPSKEMFKSWYYKVFESDFEKGIYTEENIVKTLFRDTMYSGTDYVVCPNISAMLYYQTRLKDEKVMKLLGENRSHYIRGDIAFYLLRGMKKDTLPECLSFCNLEFLLQWPWVVFIDDWINMFEIVPFVFFNWYFVCMAIERSEITRPVYKKLFGPFKDVCRILKERFSSEATYMRTAFWSIFSSQDVTMCKILFEGMENRQRQFLIRSLKEFIDCYIKDYEDALLRFNNEFRTQFYAEVARDDEERKLIPKIFTPGVHSHSFQRLPFAFDFLWL